MISRAKPLASIDKNDKMTPKELLTSGS
jgi:hypothetical protein